MTKSKGAANISSPEMISNADRWEHRPQLFSNSMGGPSIAHPHIPPLMIWVKRAQSSQRCGHLGVVGGGGTGHVSPTCLVLHHHVGTFIKIAQFVSRNSKG